MLLIFSLLSFFLLTESYHFLQHPLEKRIGYIYGLKDVSKINEQNMISLLDLFKRHPLLIFKDCNNISPTTFINFVKRFDPDHDSISLKNPDANPSQMLQPFDQFPDCKHVAPRGNVELLNFYNIKQINIKPTETFIDHYVWHTDIFGHEYKLPNVITGFYIIEQPLIGGDTDFISSETIYESLKPEEQIAAQNILVEINRLKFIKGEAETDYSGVNRLEDFNLLEQGNVQMPLVYAPDDPTQSPRVVLLPSFFEKVVGWTVEESREWIQKFMLQKVLPHRISIQWKKGDLALFNNRRFIHSSTPARNYMDNEDSDKRLLLQTFVPTTRPLIGIRPSKQNTQACYNVNWQKDPELARLSAQYHIKFANERAIKNNDLNLVSKYYTLNKKP